jgi:hypothetical protein
MLMLRKREMKEILGVLGRRTVAKHAFSQPAGVVDVPDSYTCVMNIHLMKTSESLSLAASHLTPSSFYHYYSNTNIAKTYRQTNCRAKEEDRKNQSTTFLYLFILQSQQ